MVLMGIMFIIPARPHVFMDGILDSTQMCMEKEKSKVEDHNLDELD